LLNDEELAPQFAASSSAGARERLSEWGPEREGLARVEDEIRYLRYDLASIAGSKDPPPRPLPRPETAAQRYRRDLARVQHEALKRRLHVVDD
jgi:hypothetical protein